MGSPSLLIKRYTLDDRFEHDQRCAFRIFSAPSALMPKASANTPAHASNWASVRTVSTVRPSALPRGKSLIAHTIPGTVAAHLRPASESCRSRASAPSVPRGTHHCQGLLQPRASATAWLVSPRPNSPLYIGDEIPV